MLTSNPNQRVRHSQHLMIRRSQWRFLVRVILFLCVIAVAVSTTLAQTDQDDPVKLFERGQDAHAKSDFKTALEFYDAAIRLKPEFPEAEFQRALALLLSNRKDEALQGFNRAVELRPDWAFAIRGLAHRDRKSTRLNS